MATASLTIRRLSLLVGLAAGLLLAGPGLAQATTAQAAAETDAPLQLPKMTVNGAKLADYPPIPKADLSGGGVTLKMISTCLTLGHPSTLPFDATRQGYSSYPRDIERRTLEINVAWETAQAAMGQLRWSEPDETTVEERAVEGS